MAERSRDKPGGRDASAFAPKAPRPRAGPPVSSGPPSSERTVMYVPDPSKQQPKDEGTLMLPQGLHPGSHPNIAIPAPPPPNAGLMRTQIAPPQGLGQFGAKSAPQGVPAVAPIAPIPGSGPVPGSGSGAHPGSLPGSHPGSHPGPHPASHPGSQPPPAYASMQSMPMQVPGSQPPGGIPDPRRMGPIGQPAPSMQQGAPSMQQGASLGQQVPSTGPGFRPATGAVPAMGPPPVQLQGKPDPRLVLITEPDSARAASFRLLRDNLLAKRLPRVLAVSSAAKKDGKTTCALNLALSLAERAKVLLLEGNLMDPELDKIFSISEATPVWPMNAGWLGPYRIAEFARGLHVAAVVTYPGQAAPRFDKQWFEQVIGSLRRFPYDFMIIDAAALSVSPTVSQMVATADATLLAVRSGVTTARALRRATDQIPEGKAIGVALIDAMVRT